jgi:predicted AlkP superfamily pyrophosphatase or phosphodiesterase
MLAMRRIGLGALVVVGLGALGLAFTARAPYVLPERTWENHAREFTPVAPARPGERSVVLFVFDGLAPATLRAASAPHLDRMAREGAHTTEMTPVFPSLSAPNHVSLSTGCYPERHGIVSNHFRDPQRGFYQFHGPEWLLACEPLPVVAERQGIRTAIFSWGMSVLSATQKLATLVEPYQEPPPDVRTQADKIIAQLRRPPAERPRLIAAYVTEPDKTSHRHGPTAAPTLAITRAIDQQIGRVMTAIDELQLRDRVTLIVTTDHGMVDADRFVSVERLLRRSDIDARVYASGTIAHVHLDRPGDKAEALQALARHPFLDVIDPLDPPPSARIGHSARVGDLVVSLHTGYGTADSAVWPWYLRWGNWVGSGTSRARTFKGMHGYDPERVPEVRAVFYAWGAEIRAGATPQAMRTVDVHPTVTYLLGIESGAPVDGHPHPEIATRL